MKVKIELLEETYDKVILKFPSIKIPVEVSKRYFKKLEENEEYEILRIEETTLV